MNASPILLLFIFTSVVILLSLNLGFFWLDSIFILLVSAPLSTCRRSGEAPPSLVASLTYHF